jgi:hypothetical protein
MTNDYDRADQLSNAIRALKFRLVQLVDSYRQLNAKLDDLIRDRQSMAHDPRILEEITAVNRQIAAIKHSDTSDHQFIRLLPADLEKIERLSEQIAEIEDLFRIKLDFDDQPLLGSERKSSVNSRATLDPEQGTAAEQESVVLAPLMQKMSDMQEHVDKMDTRLRRLRLWARLVPLYLIVVGLVSYPYVAAITGMSASDMT